MWFNAIKSPLPFDVLPPGSIDDRPLSIPSPVGLHCLSAFCPPASSNSAHEPQKVVVDYQALTHFKVHGRNARNKVPGKSHYGQSRGKTSGFYAQALG
jgi:hypothetical protein